MNGPMPSLLALPLLSGCAGGCTPPEDGDPDRDPIEVGDFALGVEYTQEGLAEPYAAVGVGWAKTRLEAFAWGESESAAPTNGVHTYDWSCPDRMVLATQEAGILNLQSYLSPKRAWGSVDAAGLVAGVHHWVVGPEWTGFWPSGNAEDYLAFATLVAEEARAADPEVQLGAMPIFFADEFAGNEPSEAEVEAKMGAPYTLRNDNTGSEAILDHPDLDRRRLPRRRARQRRQLPGQLPGHRRLPTRGVRAAPRAGPPGGGGRFLARRGCGSQTDHVARRRLCFEIGGSGVTGAV